MTEVHLHIERRTLEPGRPIALWTGRQALYAAYDPAQLSEDRAVQAIALLAPGMPTIAGITRTGDGCEGVSVEDIAKHGRSR